MRLRVKRFAARLAQVFVTGFCVLFSLSVDAATTKGHTPKAITALDYQTDTYLASGTLTGLTEKRYQVARRFVETTGLGKNLSLLLLDDVKKSETVAEAIKKYGFSTVSQTVVHIIKDVQASHALKWNSMMADVYSVHFAPVELTSIMQKKEQSPYFPKMLDRQPEIAGTVAVQGDAIFQSAKSKVMDKLQSAFKG